MNRLDVLRRDGLELFALCEREPAREIPSCPGWLAADLRSHIIETLRGEIPGFGDDDLTGVAAVDRAVDLLDGLDQPARNVSQECAIHRWDASAAFGVACAVEPSVACEGIWDFFALAWPMLLDYLKRPAGGGETLRLSRTDGEDRWDVLLGERPLIAESAASDPQVEVRASASDLLLWLWGRMDPPDVLGDVTVLDRMRNPTGRFLSPGF